MDINTNTYSMIFIFFFNFYKFQHEIARNPRIRIFSISCELRMKFKNLKTSLRKGPSIDIRPGPDHQKINELSL